MSKTSRHRLRQLQVYADKKSLFRFSSLKISLFRSPSFSCAWFAPSHPRPSVGPSVRIWPGPLPVPPLSDSAFPAAFPPTHKSLCPPLPHLLISIQIICSPSYRPSPSPVRLISLVGYTERAVKARTSTYFHSEPTIAILVGYYYL
ncbi:hypothetical protein B0H19DRAFT_1127877 [Mycena capillaripes]|nr:hypothetical protein B0H19DRAFT_1127877 [Mycena capillaripes]